MENDSKDYLEARFNGLEKLARAHYENINEHINAVSNNTKEIRKELQDHKDNQDAHGAAFGRRSTDKVIAWGGFLIAAGAFALTLWKHG